MCRLQKLRGPEMNLSPSITRSPPVSTEGASGNRRVTSHLYGSDKLTKMHEWMFYERANKQTKTRKATGIQRHVYIQSHLLPIFVTRELLPRSPEHRDHSDKERAIGSVFPHAETPSEAIRTVSIVARLHGTWNECTVLIKEPLRIEVRCFVSKERRVVMALPEVRRAKGLLGDERALRLIVLCRGVRNAERKCGSPLESFLGQSWIFGESAGIGVWERPMTASSATCACFRNPVCACVITAT
jgi:hypothetical protein